MQGRTLKRIANLELPVGVENIPLSVDHQKQASRPSHEIEGRGTNRPSSV